MSRSAAPSADRAEAPQAAIPAGAQDYVAHLSSWGQDLLARGRTDMPTHAGQMAADLETATQAAEGGDLKALFDTLWDWEATLDEAAAGSLRAARSRFRRGPRAGLPAREAAAGL